MSVTQMVRSNEIQVVSPDKVPGMPESGWAQLFFAQSPALPVNQTTQVGYFVVPCDCRIVAVEERILTQQAGANRTVEINKNNSIVATKALLTTEEVGARAWTVASGGDIDTALGEDLFSAGDLLSFSTPNTGSAGITALTVTLRPR